MSEYLDTEIMCASQAPHSTKGKDQHYPKVQRDVSTVQDAVFLQYFFVELETLSIFSA